MNILQGFRDQEIVAGLFARVRQSAQKVADKLGRPALFMEVCGTHTVAISRLGLRQALGGYLELRSGPGCPVCVTDPLDIDRMIDLAGVRGVNILTFGDMIRVPGSNSDTLEKIRARGASVKTVYSPSQGIEMACADPSGKYVMLGVGFETTAPIVAISIKEAALRGLKNYFVYSTHKVIPPGLRALLPDRDLKIDGLILPGHVAVVTGRRGLEFVSVEYGAPAVVTGFEPVDILGSISILLDQVDSGEARTINGYSRLVSENGNVLAQKVLEDVFTTADSPWRGFGIIPESGLALSGRWRQYDAALEFSLPARNITQKTGCCCGDLLRGKITPQDCPLFGRACTPSNPVGPCMVSSEGACAAYYNYALTEWGEPLID